MLLLHNTKPEKWDKAHPSALLSHSANKLFLQEEQEFIFSQKKSRAGTNQIQCSSAI